MLKRLLNRFRNPRRMPSCGRCHFWQDGAVPRCLRFPPYPSGDFPIVTHSKWCGEFREKSDG